MADTATQPILAAQTGSWFSFVQAAESEEAEVRIYGDIGAFGITAESFVSGFKEIRAKTINVRINSKGGEVGEATAIYNVIKSHPAHIVTHVDGFAASAGSWIALSGDEVRMADNAYMIIHEAHGGVVGEAGDMRKYAEGLDMMNDSIAGMYQKKAGKTRKYWRGKMADETWFTAEAAKAEGLVDTVVAATKTIEKARAEFDFKAFNKIPDAVREIPQTVQPAPEPSRESEPAQAITKEIQAMPETLTQTAPAQTSAAVVVSNSQQSETPQQKVARLNDDTMRELIERGKVVGRAEGRQAMSDEIRALMAICPGRPQTVLNAVMSGQNVETMKLIIAAEMNAEAAANQRAQAQEVEIAKLRADQARLMELSNIGGHPGVPMNVSVFAPGAGAGGGAVAHADAPSGLEPEAQAKLEWDSDPMIRARMNNKESTWMAFRVNQLKGAIRIKKSA